MHLPTSTTGIVMLVRFAGSTALLVQLSQAASHKYAALHIPQVHVETPIIVITNNTSYKKNYLQKQHVPIVYNPNPISIWNLSSPRIKVVTAGSGNENYKPQN